MTARRFRFALAALALAGGLAVRAAPNAAAEANAKADAALAAGDAVSAEVAARDAVRAGVPMDAVRARLGQALLDEGDRQSARRVLTQGYFAPGSEGIGWRARGRLELAEGRLPQAGQAFDLALRTIPRDAPLWTDIAMLRWRGGEQAQAYDAARFAAGLAPDFPRAMLVMGLMARAREGLAPALAWFERGLAKAPADVPLLTEYAATLGDMGRYHAMLDAVRRLDKADPGNGQALYFQAVLAARAGNTALARSILQRTGDKLRDRPAALLLSGTLELRAGNRNLAVELLDRFSRMQPEHRTGQALLARALAEDGQWRELAGRFGAVAGGPAGSAWLAGLTAQGFEMAGDRARAAPLLARAASSAIRPFAALPTTRPPEVLMFGWRENPGSLRAAVHYARALLTTGNAAQAQVVTGELRKRNPGLAGAWLADGDARFMGGDRAGALEAWRRSAGIVASPAALARLDIGLRSAGLVAEADARLASYRAANPQDLVALSLAARARAPGQGTSPEAAALAARFQPVPAAMRFAPEAAKAR